MATAQIRPLLAATAVGAVLSYGLSGHSLPQMSHDGMAGATEGLCLLLVTVLGCAVAPRPQTQRPAVASDTVPSYLASSPRPPLDGRTRASPSALQRFRN